MSTPLVSSVPHLTTMAQAPAPPWRTPEEADEYKNDPRSFILDRCALWLEGVTVFHNWIITATYYLPDWEFIPNTTVKLYKPESTHDEALYQGKCGLVIAKGPLAFCDGPGINFMGQNIDIGDWVTYDIMEGRQFTIDRIHCRRLKDTQVVMRVSDPRLVY